MVFIFLLSSPLHCSKNPLKTSLAKAKKLVQTCNRNIIAAFTSSTAFQNNFSPSDPSKGLKETCPGVKISCCTDAELSVLSQHRLNKEKEFEGFEKSIGQIGYLIDVIDTDFLAEEMRVKNNRYNMDDAEKYISELKRKRDKSSASVEQLKRNYFKYILGAICTACDQKYNSFLTDKQQQVSFQLQLQTDISSQACFDNFKRILDHIQLAEYLYSYLDLVKYFELMDHNNIILSQGLDNQFLDKEKEMIGRCNGLSAADLKQDNNCVSTCIELNNLAIWNDPFEIFTVTDIIHYVLNVKFGNLEHSEFEREFEEKNSRLQNIFAISEQSKYQLHKDIVGMVSDEGINLMMMAFSELLFIQVSSLFALFFLFN